MVYWDVNGMERKACFMAFRRCGPIESLQPGELEAAAAEVKKREAAKESQCRHFPFQTEEEQFDYLLEKIGYNPNVSVDFGDYAKLGRFYRYWSKKMLADEVPS